MKKYQILSASVVILLASCSKDKNEQVPYKGYDYVPTNIGHEIIYQVDSGYKNSFTGMSDTIHFQIREVIDSVYLDLSGRETQRISRYRRLTDSDPWVIYRVYSSNLTISTLERQEENIPYIKLIFPMLANSSVKKWEGNAKNTLGSQIYEYTSMHQPETIGSLSFDSVTTVLQLLDSTLINFDQSIEKYAARVGKILKDSTHVEICFGCSPFGTDTIDAAVYYKETVKSFSN